jgi:hypothetical protein
MRPNKDAKVQQGGTWAHYTSATQQQVPSYPLKHQVMNGSYGNCMPTQPVGGTSGSGEATHVDQMINYSDRGVGTANNIQQQESAHNAVLTQNMVIKEGFYDRDSKGTGAGAEDIYKPALWYYDLLLFTAHIKYSFINAKRL